MIPIKSSLTSIDLHHLLAIVHESHKVKALCALLVICCQVTPTNIHIAGFILSATSNTFCFSLMQIL